MIKRWLAQVGNCEFIHTSMRDALGYEEQVNVIEMVDIETLDDHAKSLENPNKVYTNAYRAGWNDALNEMARRADNEIGRELYRLARSLLKD